MDDNLIPEQALRFDSHCSHVFLLLELPLLHLQRIGDGWPLEDTVDRSKDCWYIKTFCESGVDASLLVAQTGAFDLDYCMHNCLFVDIGGNERFRSRFEAFEIHITSYVCDVCCRDSLYDT